MPVHVLVLGLLLPFSVLHTELAAEDDAAATYYGGNADDDYINLSYEDFDQVSLMPVSCVN